MYNCRSFFEIAHIIYCVVIFIFWQVVSNESDTSKRWVSELTYVRQFFFGWVIISPTVICTFTEAWLVPGSTWFKEKFPWHMTSLALKSIVYFVSRLSIAV